MILSVIRKTCFKINKQNQSREFPCARAMVRKKKSSLENKYFKNIEKLFFSSLSKGWVILLKQETAATCVHHLQASPGIIILCYNVSKGVFHRDRIMALLIDEDKDEKGGEDEDVGDLFNWD